MEAALSWESVSGLPPEIAAVVPPGAELLQAIVEYPVALPGGTTDSKSDVFALLAEGDELIVMIVEAKRDEVFGPRVSEWLADGRVGKAERLAALQEVLEIESVPAETRYQLLHRAASAVLTARRYRTTRAMVVIQSFSPERRRFADYSAFLALLGLEAGQGSPVQRSFGGVKVTFAWVTSPLSGRDLRDEVSA